VVKERARCIDRRGRLEHLLAGDVHHADGEFRPGGGAARVLRGHPHRAVRVKEVQDGGEDHAQRLVQVDDLGDRRVGEHRVRVGEVSQRRRDPRPVGEQGGGVVDDDRVEVDVGDPRGRVDRPRRLADRGPGGEPGAEVEELRDAALRRPGDGRQRERPVVPRHGGHTGVDLAYLLS
jgi:hypothetical protein